MVATGGAVSPDEEIGGNDLPRAAYFNESTGERHRMMRAATIRSATAGTPHAPLLPSAQGRQGCPSAESRRTL